MYVMEFYGNYSLPIEYICTYVHIYIMHAFMHDAIARTNFKLQFREYIQIKIKEATVLKQLVALIKYTRSGRRVEPT